MTGTSFLMCVQSRNHRLTAKAAGRLGTTAEADLSNLAVPAHWLRVPWNQFVVCVCRAENGGDRPHKPCCSSPLVEVGVLLRHNALWHFRYAT